MEFKYECLFNHFNIPTSFCRMELLQEECLALKARLDTVQQDKASDLAAYKQMLDHVRKIFQDACRCFCTINRKGWSLKRNASVSEANAPLAAVLQLQYNSDLKLAWADTFLGEEMQEI